MSYKIETIEGIGPTYGAKLIEAGIKTTDDL
jgi:predicted flap endonuclease-1-like 5' DNA nuclease